LISRRSTLALGAALVAGTAISALAVEYNEFRLAARLEGDLLHVSAPNFRFLAGKSGERLKDGNSVGFIAQMTVSGSPNYVLADAHSVARFAVSYDIWEERFSVTLIGDRSNPKRTASHLSASAAEAWCFDKLTINRAELPSDRPFYLQVDLRVEDPRDQSSVIGDTGISIARMLEVFSRPVRDKQAYPLLRSGPLRLEEVARATHEGTHE